MGHCDRAACNCFHPLQTWLFLIVNGFFGPSGNWYDALCQRCGRGNVDCTGLSGRLSSRRCWKKDKAATLALQAQSEQARGKLCDEAEVIAALARAVEFAEARAEENAAEQPLLCQPCDKDGCCRWTAGYDGPWRGPAEAFASALELLCASRTAKASLESALAGTLELTLRKTSSKKVLSTAQRSIFRTVYDHVARMGGCDAGALYGMGAIAAPLCPNVLRRLDEAEANGIDVVAFVASKCAAGDCVASKPGCPHHAFHLMLQSVAASRGVKLLVWDLATRVGPCRRAESKTHRGGCAELSWAEGWLGELVRAAMLRVFSQVAKSDVISFRCWTGMSMPTSLTRLPRVIHYRYLLASIGHADVEGDGILYRLARANHLRAWASAVLAKPLTSAEYGRALTCLPGAVAARFASLRDLTKATPSQKSQAADRKYSEPLTLDTSPEAQKAHGGLLGYSNTQSPSMLSRSGDRVSICSSSDAQPPQPFPPDL